VEIATCQGEEEEGKERRSASRRATLTRMAPCSDSDASNRISSRQAYHVLYTQCTCLPLPPISHTDTATTGPQGNQWQASIPRIVQSGSSASLSSLSVIRTRPRQAPEGNHQQAGIPLSVHPLHLPLPTRKYMQTRPLWTQN
jgi:hypothetical protein